jgi:hypothetical protein
MPPTRRSPSGIPRTLTIVYTGATVAAALMPVAIVAYMIQP